MRTIHDITGKPGDLRCSRCDLPIVHPDAQPGLFVAYETHADGTASMVIET